MEIDLQFFLFYFIFLKWEFNNGHPLDVPVTSKYPTSGDLNSSGRKMSQTEDPTFPLLNSKYNTYILYISVRAFLFLLSGWLL